MTEPQLPATIEDAPNLPALAQQAIATGNVEIAERAFALMERFEERRAEAALVEALQGFQRDCPAIEKTQPVRTDSGKVMYKFPPYDKVLKTIAPHLENWGLSFNHTIRGDGKIMVCIVRHRDGAKFESEFPMTQIEGTRAQNQMQKMASTSSMAKRYSLIDALGLATFDDDGRGADEPVTGADLKALFESHKKKHGGDVTEFRAWLRSAVFKQKKTDEQLRDPDKWTQQDLAFASETLNRVTFDDYSRSVPAPAALSEEAKIIADKLANAQSTKALGDVAADLHAAKNFMSPGEYDRLAELLEKKKSTGG